MNLTPVDFVFNRNLTRVDFLFNRTLTIKRREEKIREEKRICKRENLNIKQKFIYYNYERKESINRIIY